MTELGSILGKRIVIITLETESSGAKKRVSMVMSDMSFCTFTFDKAEIKFDSMPLNESPRREGTPKPPYKVLEMASLQKDDAEQTRVGELFHTLWTKAVAAKDYDKSQWKELLNILSEAGYQV